MFCDVCIYSDIVLAAKYEYFSGHEHFKYAREGRAVTLIFLVRTFCSEMLFAIDCGI